MRSSIALVLTALALTGCDPNDDDAELPGATATDGSSTTAPDPGATASDPDDPDPSTGSQPDPTSPSTSESGEDPGSTSSNQASTGVASSSGTATSLETSGGGDGGGQAIECEELQACCDELGPDLYGGCMTVVQMDDPGLCDQILATYHGEGYCTGEMWCEQLAACCSELPPGPGWEETCSYYAELGNQPQCAMLIGDYQLSGYCF